MKLPSPEINYRELTFSNITTERFRHLLLLLYWPFYCVIFMFLERLYPKYMSSLDKIFHVMYSPLDDIIPFNELFLIPYLFWFAYIILALVITMFYDTETFRKYMTFVIITYTIALICYFVYPSIQFLRPPTMQRKNALTAFMKLFYKFDTNTNVCPSVHVLGSFAATFAFLHFKYSTAKIKIAAHILNVLICLSTVFLKQHSIVDLFVALPITVVAYFISFMLKPQKKKTAKDLVF